LNGVLCLKLRF